MATARLSDGDGEVAQLLLPPDLIPDDMRPLAGGRTLAMRGTTMGTGWVLNAVVPPALPEARIRATLEAVFASVIAQMSQWEPGSQLSRFNAGAPGSRHPIGPQFRIVLEQALHVGRLSNGAFDPALGLASEAWGFGAGPPPDEPPGEAQLARLYDWRTLEWSEAGAELVQPGGLRLDLSGIAKGFATDMALAALGRHGIAHALLEIGGELRGIGVRADGLPWWVDIETPPGLPVPSARVALSGWAVANSGNYRRRHAAAGKSWSHTLNPRTGRPLTDEVLTVCVFHKGCMEADALATALTVLGPERGIAFADRHAVPARIVTLSATHTSGAWRAWQE